MAQRTAATTPSLPAVRPCSIFIASRTTRTSPRATARPAVTATARTTPVIGAAMRRPSPVSPRPEASGSGMAKSVILPSRSTDTSAPDRTTRA